MATSETRFDVSLRSAFRIVLVLVFFHSPLAASAASGQAATLGQRGDALRMAAEAPRSAQPREARAALGILGFVMACARLQRH